jgi:hypothetical protein
MEQERVRSLSQAKHMLRALEMKKGSTRREMLREYADVLNHVVDVISKLTTDDDCCSDTSLTVPETIVSGSDSSTLSFLLCGGAVDRHEEVTQRWIDDGDTDSGYWKRDDTDCFRDDDACDSDDDLSISSDVVPLFMTDEDAIDEIDFTRELMGYVEGFEAHDMPISRIEEEGKRDIPVSMSASRSPRSSNSKRVRPPLPTRARSHGTKSSVGTAPIPKQKKSHRRQRSGGSIPTIVEKEDPRRLRRSSFSHQSLPERRMISCSTCRRRTVEGEVCDCGKWEI